MQAEDFDKFRDGISGVMAFYGGKTVFGFALDVWWNSLKAHDLPAVVNAFNRHVANPDTGQFPPKPADITTLEGPTEDVGTALGQRSIRQSAT